MFTQSEVIVCNAPSQPQSEVVSNRANRVLGPYQLQEAESKLSVDPSFPECIPEQAKPLQTAKSRTGSLQ